MNLVTVISATLVAMALIELLLTGMDRMKRDLFIVAMLTAFVGFTSKYYYGPDIAVYVPLYDATGTLADTLAGHHPGGYEIGFILFLSLCRTVGLSFWGMTAVISCLFFGALYLLLRRLPDKRVLALSLLVALMPDLIYAQLRQCLAVTLFVGCVVTAETVHTGPDHSRGRIALAVALAAGAALMHKSALFIILPTAAYYLMQPRRVQVSLWAVLAVALAVLAIVPTEGLIGSVIDHISSTSSTAESLKMHLAFAKLHQTNFVLYMLAIVLLGLYSHSAERRSAIAATAAAGLIMMVALYQYYFLLSRLRSYFLPVAVYYIFSVMARARAEHRPYVHIVRQIAEILVIVFMSYKVWSFDVNSQSGRGVLRASTIFELADHKPEELRDRQMLRAEQFWQESFLKSDMSNTKQKNVVPDKNAQ